MITMCFLGNISITLDTSFFEPLDSSSQSDVDAADRMLQFTVSKYNNKSAYYQNSSNQLVRMVCSPHLQ